MRCQTADVRDEGEAYSERQRGRKSYSVKNHLTFRHLGRPRSWQDTSALEGGTICAKERRGRVESRDWRLKGGRIRDINTALRKLYRLALSFRTSPSRISLISRRNGVRSAAFDGNSRGMKEDPITCAMVLSVSIPTQMPSSHLQKRVVKKWKGDLSVRNLHL